MTDLVTASRSDGVLVVRLSNPQGRNSIGPESARQLHGVLSDLTGVGAIALLADGDHFCVGGDVRAMAAAGDAPAFVQELADELHRSMRVLRAGPPVVVGARGWAAGAGMSIVVSADIAIAGEGAMLQPAYPGIGVTPDGGMTYDLPRLVGERQARSLILRNVALSAAQALELGIVDEVVADSDVDDRALSIARELAAGPTQAFVGAKRLLADSAQRTYGEQLDAEAASISSCVGSPEGIEGITAFTERRAPAF